jgi:hypothetical protein
MSNPIAILHLMNGFGDSSISWIVHRLVKQMGVDEYTWHVSGLCGLGTMANEFKRLGVRTIDFSKQVNPWRYTWRRIRQYLIDYDISIIHSHTPRTIL